MRNNNLRLISSFGVMLLPLAACSQTSSSIVSSTGPSSSSTIITSSATSSYASSSKAETVTGPALLTIDFNPSFAILLNEEDKIDLITALNDDAEMVLLGIDVIGLQFNYAFTKVFDEAKALNMIKADENILEIDVMADSEQLKNRIRTMTQSHINAVFAGNMAKVQVRNRFYTLAEVEEANAHATTPLQLRAGKLVTVANEDFVLDEVDETGVNGLLLKLKTGATNLNKIANSYRNEYIEEKTRIQNQNYLLIDPVVAQIAQYKNEARSTVELEATLLQLRNQLRLEVQNEFSECEMLSLQARVQMQVEAAAKKQPGTPGPGSGGNG